MTTLIALLKAGTALAILGFIAVRANAIRKYGMKGLKRGFKPNETKEVIK